MRYLALLATIALAGAMPGPPTFYQWVVPLEFDGSTFSVPKSFTTCGGAWDSQPYVAPLPKTLVLDAATVVASNCGVPPQFCESLQLYIVAFAFGSRQPSRQQLHFDARSSFPAIAIAGPSSSTHPWKFAPIQPGVHLQPDKSYAFFVACIVAV